MANQMNNVSPTQLSSALLRAFDVLFRTMTFTTIFLPSGTIYGINVKFPFYFILLPLALYRFFRQQATLSNVILLFAIPALLTVWLVVGLSHGIYLAGTIRQYMDMALTILLCWMAVLYTGENEERRLSYLRLVLNAEVATALLKLGLVTYALARGIPVVQIMNAISIVFGVDLMTMDLGALLGRVQFVSDSIIPVCIFLTLRHRVRLNIGSFRASLTIVLLFVSVLLSFSRYFWGFSVFALVLGLMLGKKDKFKLGVVGVLTSAVLLSLPSLVTLYELRFSHEVAGASDRDRFEQVNVLTSFFLEAPLFGHGLGSYSPQLLRVSATLALRYGYEMQLLALAGQVGLVGICFFMAMLLWYYRRLWWRSPLSIPDRLGLAGMILFWLSVGWYNPLLINPIASVVFASFAVLTALTREPLPIVKASLKDAAATSE